METTGLTKSYGQEVVVDHINLQIKAGEIYGLLGANGAGKTTLMKMISTLVHPSEGEILLFGEKLTEDSSLLMRVGSMIETPVFYENLSAEENLVIHCKYKNADLNLLKDYLEILGIYEARHKKVKQFSLGMKQRLGIARALIGDPLLLVLDEPINGLDPEGIKEIRELLKFKGKQNTAILISSHILSEIEQCAERIGFMQQGKLKREVRTDEIHQLATTNYEITLPPERQGLAKLQEIFKNSTVTEGGVRISSLHYNAMEVAEVMIENRIEFLEIKYAEDKLESYYMSESAGERLDVK
ncbi:ABC transporter ATP-binding protein [Paenibacillus sp. 2TAF8]|uniref:ABC transporter ATP-binding protein n=1 Tax=Paenibacillus sp. 2TAF8 TaxID=3233020 RepID=UPI003F9E5554